MVQGTGTGLVPGSQREYSSDGRGSSRGWYRGLGLVLFLIVRGSTAVMGGGAVGVGTGDWDWSCSW